MLDEGFEQERPATVLDCPFGGDLPGNASQDGRGRILAFNPRQAEESSVLYDAEQTLLPLRGRPTDTVVARLGLPGDGSEAEQGGEPSARANEAAQLGTW